MKVIGMIINPGGAEPLADATREQAAANMQQLLADCGLDDLSCEPRPAKDYDKREVRGKFAFVVSRRGRRKGVEVQMPGIALELVRYVDGDAWGWPRLYVDGNSWLWLLAVKEIVRILTGERDWREDLRLA